ncbi:two component transcriptional regulator, winged helix family [Catenulispora acidiphila DSM 44928]|uniref:Two component transcriptional regulator, winged helix family n=1 Tax=Catenulispora acidiphila (strain DSM 44928 / JCM 14897 / NBRC 102108 / NRRL B-24433 / ID139908) TaxID=479433 RepID=C7QAE5_CATAD|nr:response regulator transcription factor [Catenulispora acidiphila]ACU72444.1 two component transcriptional regulator, winged helix family [Catenulispora acidiphila DSM 44928]
MANELVRPGTAIAPHDRTILPTHPARRAVPDPPGRAPVLYSSLVRPALRILVAEPDPDSAEQLLRKLRRQGHRAEVVHTGDKALIEFPSADLVLLDLELPDVDGLEICRGIRAVSDVAIITVSERAEEIDCVLGLQAGSDDYLVKPYGFRELMARIDAVMRRIRPGAVRDRVIAHGRLLIDAGCREVRIGGQVVGVTRKEFDLLLLLASQPGTVISRQQIMSQIWQDVWSESTRTIDTHVSSLRSKLGSGSWIVTVRGVGFQLGTAPD